ncbi:carboxypeptidase regulatory-like domain-containing protein [Myxococcus stipitatus]|nr:carboxypeptidase regulatory-like domain-containing protein [Myxococcus stipitatus]
MAFVVHATPQKTAQAPRSRASASAARGPALMDVQGIVRDDAGQPIEGATVHVYVGQEQAPRVAATTRANGAFTLRTLPIGPCRIVVDAKGYLGHEDAEAELSAPTSTLDFTLKRAVIIEGVVVDPTGRPLPYGWVTLDRLDAPPAPPAQQATADEEAPGTTDDDEESPWMEVSREGRFFFELAQPGRYLVRASARRFYNFRDTLLEVDAPARNLRLDMREGARLDVTVADPRGQPVRSAKLTLFSVEPPNTRHELEQVSTRDDGSYFFLGLPPGDYAVSARLPSGSPGEANDTFQVQEDTKTVAAKLVLETGVSISGVVVNEEGSPMRGAYVVGTATTKDGGELRQDSTTDEHGRFTLRHMQVGPTHFRVQYDYYTLLTTPPTEPDDMGLSPTVALNAGTGEIRLVLRRNGGIRGRVVREDGTPITRFTLNEADFESKDGSFEINANPGPPERRVKVTAPGLAPHVGVANVVFGKVTDVGALVLKPGRSIRGTVRDARTSAPIPGVDVLTRTQDIEGSRFVQYLPATHATTGPDGTFEMPHVPTQALTLELRHPKYLERSMELGEGNQALALSLASEARLSVTVVDRKGRPAGDTVDLQCLDDLTPRNGVQVTDGAATVEQLTACTYGVSVVEQTHDFTGRRKPRRVLRRFMPQTVKLAMGEHASVTFREMAGPTTLTLRHSTLPRLPTGEAVAFAHAVLLPGEVPAPQQLGRADFFMAIPPDAEDAASMRVSGLTPGRYTYLLEGTVAADPERRVVHREVVEVKGQAQESRTVKPAWPRVTATP